MYIEILDGPRTADQYQFESNKAFMDFLHTLYPRSNDEWETEPIGHIKDMYAAYQAGQSYVSDEGGGPILPLEHPRLRSCSEVAREDQAARAKEALDILTDDQRADLFAEYCKWCGSKDPSCLCIRDIVDEG